MARKPRRVAGRSASQRPAPALTRQRAGTAGPPGPADGEHRRAITTPPRPSTAGAGSGAQAQAERDTALDRLVFFSDAVFAIAITLLALDLRLPALPAHASEAAVLTQLLALGPHYVSFGLSFLAVGLYWLGHHRMFQSIARYDPLLLVLNLALLMCVAFIPFPSSVIGAYPDRASTIFYALTLAMTGLLSGGLWLYASSGGRLLTAELDRRSFRLSQVRSFLPPILFLLSAALGLWSPTLAITLWYVIALGALLTTMVAGRWTAKTD